MPLKTFPACSACKDGIVQPFPFSMAFQPIVDLNANRVFAYEALVRGVEGQSAASILGRVSPENLYTFDQSCRVKAISLAMQLGIARTGANLTINFIPGAVYSPQACIQLTLRTARSVGFPIEKLIFEFTETEEVVDRRHLQGIVHEYRRHGLRTALDDFGSGFSGLNLLADVTPDILKLDMELTRNLDQRPAAVVIVKQMVSLASQLNIALVAEGIETLEEYEAVRRCGISLVQGYLLARPGFEYLPDFTLPALAPMPPSIPSASPVVLRS